MEVNGRCDLTPGQSAALWRSKVVHIVLLPIMTLVSTWRIQVSGASQLVWVFILLLAAGLVEEFGGAAEVEEQMVNAFGKGGSAPWRLCAVLASFLLGTMIAATMMLSTMAG